MLWYSDMCFLFPRLSKVGKNIPRTKSLARYIFVRGKKKTHPRQQLLHSPFALILSLDGMGFPCTIYVPCFIFYIIVDIYCLQMRRRKIVRKILEDWKWWRGRVPRQREQQFLMILDRGFLDVPWRHLRWKTSQEPGLILFYSEVIFILV